jgi:hypothetical protein
MPEILDVWLLGSSTKQLRKAALSFVTSPRPSMPMEQHQSHHKNFRKIVYLGLFLMSFELFSIFSDLDKK